MPHRRHRRGRHRLRARFLAPLEDLRHRAPHAPAHPDGQEQLYERRQQQLQQLQRQRGDEEQQRGVLRRRGGGGVGDGRQRVAVRRRCT